MWLFQNAPARGRVMILVAAAKVKRRVIDVRHCPATSIFAELKNESCINMIESYASPRH